jgi:hypothetical protein
VAAVAAVLALRQAAQVLQAKVTLAVLATIRDLVELARVVVVEQVLSAGQVMAYIPAKTVVVVEQGLYLASQEFAPLMRVVEVVLHRLGMALAD